MKYKYIVAIGGLNHFDTGIYRFNDMTKQEAIMAISTVLAKEHRDNYAHDPTVDDLVVQHIFGSDWPIVELL